MLVLRLTDGEDPRLERAERVLRVNRLAITAVKDTRPPHPPPLWQPERYLAFVLARTTGPQTRIVARRKSVPDISLYGREVETNPLTAQSRQGASGMLAALAGFPRKRLKVISLGDSSCRQSFPPLERLTVNGGWSYFPVRTAFWPADFVQLDFSEGDLIGGSEVRLAETIRRIKNRVKKPLVVIVQTCISRLIGDDILGVCRRELGEGQFLVLDPDFQSKQGAVDSLLWPWLFRAYVGKSRGSKAKGALVNLVGFGHREKNEACEIEGILAALDISVNARIFPSFSEKELEHFHRSKTTLASDCSVVKNAFAGVEESRSWLFLSPPFGIDGTSRWLDRVCRSILPAKRRRQAMARIRAAADEAKRKLGQASAPLKGESLAIAASSSLSAFIFNHSEIFGIPAVDMAREIGLSVEIFIHADAPLPRELHAVTRARNVSLSTFDQPGPMLQALSDSRAAFLLTSIARNAGALARGKYPLFPSDFEMGYAGAVRTAEKLACRKKSGFAERHRRWFAS